MRYSQNPELMKGIIIIDHGSPPTSQGRDASRSEAPRREPEMINYLIDDSTGRHWNTGTQVKARSTVRMTSRQGGGHEIA